MATLKELRIRARLSAEALGRLANVDGKTVTRAESGLPVQELKAIAIVEALGQALGIPLKIEDLLVFSRSRPHSIELSNLHSIRKE